MPKAAATSACELLRVLGIIFGLAVVVGGIVGQGIMRTPGIVAGALPDPLLIMAVWALGGLIILVDACGTVELGASMPRSGGPYVFADRAFGPIWGTMLGWADWLSWTLAIAYISVVFAEYAQRLGIGTGLPEGVLAVLLIVSVSAINWSGTRTSGASQIVGSAIKGFGLLALIVVLMLAPHGSAPAVAADTGPSAGPALGIATFAIAMRAVAITYGGWGSCVYFCEELHQPERNVVRATFGGIVLVILLYLGVNAALLHVLTPAQIAASKLPVADATAAVLGPMSGVAITALALFSVVAICNLFVMSTSRIGYAMARNHVLPSLLARVSASGTPRASMLCTAGVAAALASSGGYERLIAMGAPFTIGVAAVCDLAAIRMRFKEPALHRPFRMPLFPLPAVFGFCVNALLVAAVIYEDPFNSSLGIGLVAAVGVVMKLRERMPARRVAV
jgi:APA family basic amino acid/polyamine antiporter